MTTLSKTKEREHETKEWNWGAISLGAIMTGVVMLIALFIWWIKIRFG